MKKQKYIYCVILSLGLLAICNYAFSQSTTSSQGLVKVTDEIFVLSRYGCNIAIVVGKDGLLTVDSGYKGAALKTDSVISTISKLPIKYILDTHIHYDHLGGNKKLSEDGAVIVSHVNTRKAMLVEWNMPEIAGIKYPIVPPYSKEFLPTICFQDSLTVYFENEVIKCIHYPNGHSDGDVIYFFQKTNLIHTGDLFLSNGFPIIGSSIDGYIEAVDNIIKICNDKTIIVPGHGPVSNRKELQDYRIMLFEGRNRIDKLVKEGKTVDEVIAANPTKDLFKGGKSWLPDKLFVATVHMDLSKK